MPPLPSLLQEVGGQVASEQQQAYPVLDSGQSLGHSLEHASRPVSTEILWCTFPSSFLGKIFQVGTAYPSNPDYPYHESERKSVWRQIQVSI